MERRTVKVGQWVAFLADRDSQGIARVRLGKMVKIAELITFGHERIRQTMSVKKFYNGRPLRLEIELPDGEVREVMNTDVVQIYRWVPGISGATLLREGDHVELATDHYPDPVKVRGIFRSVDGGTNWVRVPYPIPMMSVLNTDPRGLVRLDVVGEDISDYVPGTIVKAILL